MRDQVFWRKTARIIIILADKLGVSSERAMDIFYNSETYLKYNNPESGLQLLSDYYVVENIIRELETRNT